MKKQFMHLLTLVLGLWLLGGCAQEMVLPETLLSNEALWEAAMADAVFSDDDEVMELVTLTAGDPQVIWDEDGEQVLLLTWHDYAEACAPGDVLAHEESGLPRWARWKIGMEKIELALRIGSCVLLSCWAFRMTAVIRVLPHSGFRRGRCCDRHISPM